MLSFFVYGTLRPGASHDSLWRQFEVTVQPALALGGLYRLILGYPAMVSQPPGQGWVRGDRLTLIHPASLPAMLSVLDDYETHDPESFRHAFPHVACQDYEYARQKIETFDLHQRSLGPAWAYLMQAQQIVALDGIHIPTGSW